MTVLFVPRACAWDRFSMLCYASVRRREGHVLGFDVHLPCFPQIPQGKGMAPIQYTLVASPISTSATSALADNATAGAGNASGAGGLSDKWFCSDDGLKVSPPLARCSALREAWGTITASGYVTRVDPLVAKSL